MNSTESSNRRDVQTSLWKEEEIMKPLIRILKIYVQHLDIFKERENSLLITHDHFDPFFFFLT